MANEELKERRDLYAELVSLEQEYTKTLKQGNTTVEDRTASIQEAIAYSDDNVKLGEIQKDLQKKANDLSNDGKKILAKKYAITAASVTHQIAENKITAAREKKQKKIHEATKKAAESLHGMVKSSLSIFGIGGGILAVFTKFAAMTATIGKEFGALGMTNEQFKNDMLVAGKEATRLGQSITEIATVSKELTDNFGFGRDESVEMANNIIDTSMALGISNTEGTKLLGTLTQVAGMSFDTAQNFAKQTALLAEAEGVSPNTVMRDIANSSESIAKFTGMTPEHLMKAAIQATRLGTTLSTIAGSMEGMLEFQSSLNAEIEASVMLGRDVNLQKARELALAGKADEFAVELTKQVGSQAEFEAMNVLQRKSLATALGISVEQMSKMVNNQEKVRTLGEAIAAQPGLEKMIGENALDNISKIINNLKTVGAELIISIGPMVGQIAGGFASVTKTLSEMKGIVPIITGLLGVMAGKSMLNFAFSIATMLGKQATFLGPLGIGLALGIPAIVGGLIGGIKSVASAQEGGITTQEGLVNVHPQEAIVPIEKLGGMIKDAMKPIADENRKLREQNETLIGETRRIGLRTAEAIANI
jgi:hypothetical protein